MPVKLSGDLVNEARESAKMFNRSLTGQIEHWASIGRAIEAQMSGESLTRLLERVGGTLKISRTQDAEQRDQIAAVLSEFLRQSPEATDHSWLEELSARGIPLYGTTSAEPGKIVRRDPTPAAL